MELEKQVCSLELAKELKKLGAKQDSLWYWFVRYKDNSYGFLGGGINGKTELLEDKDLQHYSAYTVNELGEILNNNKNGNIWNKTPLKEEHPLLWYFVYKEKKTQVTHSFEADTEADARVKMLIYLIKEKLIKV